MANNKSTLVKSWLKNNWVRAPLLGLLVLSSAQCGNNKGLSAGVTLEMNPSTPIIVLSDLSIPFIDATGTVETATFTAPWYKTNMKIVNGSNAFLSVVGFKYNITYLNNGQVATKNNISFDLSTLDPRFRCQATTGVQRAMLVTGMKPGATYTTLTDPCDSATVTTLDGNNNPKSDIFYINSLPTTTNNSTSYFIEFNAQGWFEDGPYGSGTPVERYVGQAFVSTE